MTIWWKKKKKLKRPIQNKSKYLQHAITQNSQCFVYFLSKRTATRASVHYIYYSFRSHKSNGRNALRGIARASQQANEGRAGQYNSLTSRSSGLASFMTPVRWSTTNLSVSCMPYLTGEPSGSWPLSVKTLEPTGVASYSVNPMG